MRLVSVAVKQWGARALPALKLARAGRLQVVVGPNEAGKSTTLRALRGLVRGLTEGDPGPMPLRGAEVQAEVTDDRGRSAEVVRRGSDGARAALRVAGDLPVAAAWSRVSAEAYDTVWCIDHDTLRRGGRALQRSDSGELGAVLLGSLLDGDRLHAVSSAVNSRVEALFNPAGNARKQELNRATLALREALAGVRDATLDTAELERREKAERDARSALASAQAALNDADRRVMEAHRLFERAPSLAQLSLLDAELDRVRSSGPVPTVPQADAALRARVARDEAHTALAAAEAAQRAAEDRLREIGADPEAEALWACWTEAARSQEAHRLAEEAAPRRASAAAAAEGAWAVAAAAAGALPAPAEVDALRGAARRLLDAEAADRSAGEVAAEARVLWEAACDRLRAAPAEPPPDDALDAASARMERTRGPWDLARGHAEARAAQRKQLDTDAQRLGLAGGAAAVEALRVPGDGERQSWALRLTEADAEVRRAQTVRDQAQGRADSARRELGDVPLPAGVPDEAALARARQARDAVVAGVLAGQAEARGDLVGRVRHADELADARFVAAGTLGRRAQLDAALRRADEELRRAQAGREVASAERRSLEEAWREQRDAWGLPAVPLTGLADWVRGVEALRDELRRWEQVEVTAAAAVREAEDALHGLQAALGAPPEPLAVQAALMALQAAARVRAERAELRQTLHALAGLKDDAQRRLDTALAQRAGAASRLQAAAAEWAQMAAAAGGPVAGGAGAADAWLSRVEAAHLARDERDAANAELASVHGELRRFDGLTAPLCALLDHDPGPAARLARTERRVDAARANAVRREQEKIGLAGLQARVEAARAAAARAEVGLAAALAGAGLTFADVLDAAHARAAKADQIEGNRAVLMGALQGVDLDELRVSIAGRDEGELRAAVASAEHDRDRAGAVRDGASKALDAAVTARAAVDGGEAAAAAAQQAAVHAAFAAQAAEELVRERAVQWMLVELQRELAEAEQRGPVTRAGEVFARFTCGSFSGLEVLHETVEGRQVRYLAGVRPNGETLVPSMMSDGTRDALWLALRVAAIEAELDRGVCVPVVLDDVVIHLSDDRTAAVLGVFDELAARTQVLLFTHHESVAALAEERVEGCEIVRLGGRPADSPPARIGSPPADPLHEGPSGARASVAPRAPAPRPPAPRTREAPAAAPPVAGVSPEVWGALVEARTDGRNRGELIARGVVTEAEWTATRAALGVDPRVHSRGNKKGCRYYATGFQPPPTDGDGA